MFVLRRAGIVFDSVITVLAHFSGWLLALMALAVTYEVIMRYFFNRPSMWVVDTSEFILLYATFLAAAWVLKHDGHVKVDILLSFLSSKHQRRLNVFTSLLGFLVTMVLFWQALDVTWDSFQRGIVMSDRGLPTPKHAVLAAMPVGWFLLAIQFLRRAWTYRVVEEAKGLKIQPANLTL